MFFKSVDLGSPQLTLIYRLLLLYCLTVVLTGLSPAVQANSTATQQTKTSKVKVGRATEFEEVTEFNQAITNFDDLTLYLEQRQYASAVDAIDQIQRFITIQSSKSQPLGNLQLQVLDLALAELLIETGQLQQSQAVLDKYSQTEMTEVNWLLNQQWQSRIQELQQHWFTATTGYKSAFNLAQQLLTQHTSHAKQPVIKRVQVDSALALAKIYWHILDNHQAKHWLTVALNLASPEQNLALYFEIVTQVASQQQQMALFVAAQRALIPAIDVANSQKLLSVELSLSQQLSDVYLASGQLEQAQALLEQTYVVARGLRNIPQQYALLLRLIELNLKKEDVSQAFNILNETDKLSRYITDMQLRYEFLQVKAQVLAAKRQFIDALAVLEKSQKLMADNLLVHNTPVQQNAQQQLKYKASWQALLGQSRTAITNFEKYHDDAQHLLMQKAQQRIQYIQQSYATDKQQNRRDLVAQQQTIEQLEKEKAQLAFESTRNFIVYVLMFLAALCFWLYYRKQQLIERQRLMNLDLITGAKNHNYLARRFRQYTAHKAKFSLIMFDLDKFAEINIALGHEQADWLCRQIVQRLSIRLSPQKELISLSSGKFMVIVENFDQKQAFLLAEILRKELNNQAFMISGQSVAVTASFAAVEWRQNETLESLKQALVLGVQIAKQAGGDRTARLTDE